MFMYGAMGGTLMVISAYLLTFQGARGRFSHRPNTL